MLLALPTELFVATLDWLDFESLDALLDISPLATIVQSYINTHYRFHFKIKSLLKLFESLTPSERHKKETQNEMAEQVLRSICRVVRECPKHEHRDRFSELLDIVQQLVLRRILDDRLRSGLESDYANLCLVIRSTYLHTPSIRVLHDPKYRRRSTKHPLAPFLPRDYTWVWRSHCSGAKATPVSRTKRLRFARFFGSLFEVTNLYLESNLEGTFEECVREGLVSGEVESILVLCHAADRPVDADAMCMMVTHAGEQLWSYLNTMADVADNEGDEDDPATLDEPPSWLLPERYKINPDTKLRLKLLDYLCKRGWDWFH